MNKKLVLLLLIVAVFMSVAADSMSNNLFKYLFSEKAENNEEL